MKQIFIITSLFLCMQGKSQRIERSMVIDSVIYKKHQGHMILLHRIGKNYWAGILYVYRGLGRPQVAAGDTAVLIRNDRKHFDLPYVTIRYKQDNHE